MSDSELEYVGFWPRVGATIVDCILIEIITLPVFFAFYGSAVLGSDKLIEGPMDFLLTYIFPVVATILFWFWKQATPGKMLLAAKIVDEKTLDELKSFGEDETDEEESSEEESLEDNNDNSEVDEKSEKKRNTNFTPKKYEKTVKNKKAEKKKRKK